MTEITIDPLYIEIGIPALLAGLLIGALITWAIARRRNKTLSQSVPVALISVAVEDERSGNASSALI